MTARDLFRRMRPKSCLEAAQARAKMLFRIDADLYLGQQGAYRGERHHEKRVADVNDRPCGHPETVARWDNMPEEVLLVETAETCAG